MYITTAFPTVDVQRSHLVFWGRVVRCFLLFESEIQPKGHTSRKFGQGTQKFLFPSSNANAPLSTLPPHHHVLSHHALGGLFPELVVVVVIIKLWPSLPHTGTMHLFCWHASVMLCLTQGIFIYVAQSNSTTTEKHLFCGRVCKKVWNVFKRLHLANATLLLLLAV